MTATQPLKGRRYLIDWDSTINDFDGHFVKTLNEKFGTTHTVMDLTDWDWVRNHPDLHVDYMWGDEVFNNREWTIAIPAKAGAVLAINRLIDAGAKVDIVTSRPVHHDYWLQEWLENQKVYKAVGYVTEDKAEHAYLLKCDAAVEDSPKHIKALAKVCPVYVVDMPYNRDIPWATVGSHEVERVPSLWVAVEKIMEGVE